MSINTTSVPNPVVRENDISSKHNAWSETQGSATGSKDGQFSSFWDKAFTGAQKLFGIEATPNETIESDEEPSRKDEYRGRANEKSHDERRLSTGLEIRNSRLRRLSISIKQDDFPELISFDKHDWPHEGVSNVADVNGLRNAKGRINEGVQPEDDFNESDEEGEEDLSSKSDAAIVADDSVLRMRYLAQKPLNTMVGNPLNVDKQVDNENSNPIGINSAIQEENMRSLPISNSSKESSSDRLSSVKTIEEVSSGGIRNFNNDRTVEARFANGPELDGAKGLERETSRSGLQNTRGEIVKSGEGNQAKAANSLIGERKSGDDDLDSLEFDLARTKQNLSTVIDKGKSLVSQKLGSTSSGNTSVVHVTGSQSSLNDSSSLIDKDSFLENSNKNFDTNSQKTGATKSVSNVQIRQDLGKSQPTTIDNSSSESNSGQRTETQAVGSLNRSSRSLETKGQLSNAGTVSQIVQTNTSESNRGTLNPSTGLGVSSQSKDASAKSGAKTEMDVAVKGTGSSKVPVPSSKNDSPQGISPDSIDKVESSKSSFTTKAQPSRFTSKSVEETKEVYAALSKSVERLAASKGNTVSIRINFDQGGSMALRVSMDSGQVNTAMQTDLPGLESLIKSSWSEFANEWNQKGLKLGTPQFSNYDNEQSKNENSLSYEQRGGQAKDGSSSDPKTSGNRNSKSPNQRPTEKSLTNSTDRSLDHDVDPEQELKAYA